MSFKHIAEPPANKVLERRAFMHAEDTVELGGGQQFVLEIGNPTIKPLAVALEAEIKPIKIGPEAFRPRNYSESVLMVFRGLSSNVTAGLIEARHALEICAQFVSAENVFGFDRGKD